jgi:hypothetical protein
MQFSKPLKGTSIRVTDFTFQNSLSLVTYSYTLTSTTIFQSQSDLNKTIILDMRQDLVVIQSQFNVFQSQSTAYLRFQEGAVVDTSGSNSCYKRRLVQLLLLELFN